MSKLIITTEANTVTEVPLARGSYRIGRKPDNDITIDDSTVSGSHARIEVLANPFVDDLDDIRIEDLGSTNGTLVNGRKVQKAMLRGGDRLQLGSCEILVDAPAAPDFDKTVIVKGDQVRAQAQAGSVYLQLLNGPKAGLAMELVKKHTSVGNAGISVVIAQNPQGYSVSQLEGRQTEGSQAPTLNGKAIGLQALPLAADDVIEIAGMQVQFRRK